MGNIGDATKRHREGQETLQDYYKDGTPLLEDAIDVTPWRYNHATPQQSIYWSGFVIPFIVHYLS